MLCLKFVKENFGLIIGWIIAAIIITIILGVLQAYWPVDCRIHGGVCWG